MQTTKSVALFQSPGCLYRLILCTHAQPSHLPVPPSVPSFWILSFLPSFSSLFVAFTIFLEARMNKIVSLLFYSQLLPMHRHCCARVCVSVVHGSNRTLLVLVKHCTTELHHQPDFGPLLLHWFYQFLGNFQWCSEDFLSFLRLNLFLWMCLCMFVCFPAEAIFASSPGTGVIGAVSCLMWVLGI